MESCNEFDSFMIFKIKNAIGAWPDEFHIVYKNTKASAFSNVMVKTVSLDNNWGKKLFFEKKKKNVSFWQGYIFSISSGVREMP